MKKILILLTLCLISVRAQASDLETVNLAFTITPQTVVKANQSTMSANVLLGPVIPGVKTEGAALDVSVLTNSNEPYRVYHELRGDVGSSSGGEFPEEELMMSVTPGRAGGHSEVSGKMKVERTRTLIFSSNATGDADQFQIRYSLKGDKPFSAGNYYGNIYLDVENA